MRTTESTGRAGAPTGIVPLMPMDGPPMGSTEWMALKLLARGTPVTNIETELGLSKWSVPGIMVYLCAKNLYRDGHVTDAGFDWLRHGGSDTVADEEDMDADTTPTGMVLIQAILDGERD